MFEDRQDAMGKARAMTVGPPRCETDFVPQHGGGGRHPDAQHVTDWAPPHRHTVRIFTTQRMILQQWRRAVMVGQPRSVQNDSFSRNMVAESATLMRNQWRIGPNTGPSGNPRNIRYTLLHQCSKSVTMVTTQRTITITIYSALGRLRVHYACGVSLTSSELNMSGRSPKAQNLTCCSLL